MKKVRRVDLVPDEYIAGIVGLRGMEIAVYLVLNLLQYSSGKPISENDERLYSIIADHRNAIKPAIKSLVDKGKIQRTPEGDLSQTRVTLELEMAQERMRKSRDNGKGGGRPPTRKQQNQEVTKPEAFSDKNPSLPLPQSPSLSSSLDVTPHTPQGGDSDLEIPESLKRYTNEFLEWWGQYPHKVGKADAAKAFKKARKVATLAELIEGARRYVRDKHPDRPWCNPATFLNQERWTDEPAPIAERESSAVRAARELAAELDARGEEEVGSLDVLDHILAQPTE